MNSMKYVFNKFKGISKNSVFFLRARKHGRDNCKGAGGCATQEAKVESLSYRALWVLKGLNEGVRTALTQMSGKQYIFRGALKWVFAILVSLTSVTSYSEGVAEFKHKFYGDSNKKNVVGYFTEWGVYVRDYHVKNIIDSGAAEELTHIIYAFGNVVDGRCQIGDSYAALDKYYDAQSSVDGVADSWEDGALRGNFGQLKRLKALFPDLKILWSFGGWTWSSGFSEAAQNPEAFAESCFNLVNDSRWAGVFDGIDIDWEYPNECGLTCDTSGYNAFPELMAAMRARFGDQMVVAAIPAGESKLAAADYAAAAKYVNFYMLMSYDFYGTWDSKGPTAPHSPLFPYPGIPNEKFTADYAVQVLLDKGIPENKILLGLGFYGRGWTDVSSPEPGADAGGAAAGVYEAGVNDYKVLKEKCPVTGFAGGTAYGFCAGDWWSYDTPTTIGYKMSYVRYNDLGGAFFWELSGDTAEGELVKAVARGLGRNCTYDYFDNHPFD